MRLELQGLPQELGESSDEENVRTLRQSGASPVPSGSGRLGKTQSAPLLPAAHSTQGLTWYPGSCSQASGSRLSCWRPLGATWRDWEGGGAGRTRSAADDGSSFVQGCVPHWGKDTALRAKGVLEHELTWAYYRMRRHVQHPLRKQMGETLPQSDIIGGMRFGKGSEFNFWRDLRPPFFVLETRRTELKEGEGALPQPHADGDLYRVTYECGIEYCSEHMMGAKGEGGVYDNRIHSDALVRFSNDFPQKRPLHIVSWGKPVLNWMPSGEHERTPAVDPDIWMPIADELGVRPDAPSMKTCRALTREANGRKNAKDRRGVEVPELERLLLGPHASLPRLAAATHNHLTASSKPRAVPPGVARKRSHTMYTPAAGFVRYAG